MIANRRLFLQLSLPTLGALALGCGSSSTELLSGATSNSPTASPLTQLISRSERQISFFVDNAGNLFELDQRRAIISKFDAQGKPLWQVNLKGLDALQVDTPVALTVDPQQRIWLLDRALSKLLLLDDRGQPLQVLAPPPSMLRPQDVVAGPSQIFVSDGYLHRILIFGLAGEFLGQFGQDGLLNYPRGMAIDAQQRLHVVDTGNSRVVVFSLDGRVVATYGQGLFLHGRGMDIHREGLIAVTDSIGRAIRLFSPQLTSLGSLSPSWQGQPLAPLDLQFTPTGSLQILAEPVE